KVTTGSRRLTETSVYASCPPPPSDDRTQVEAGWTGLLTHDDVWHKPPAPSHPDGQWLLAGFHRRLQLRGSGGFSPRFPFIPPSVCDILPGLKLDSFLSRNT